MKKLLVLALVASVLCLTGIAGAKPLSAYKISAANLGTMMKAQTNTISVSITNSNPNSYAVLLIGKWSTDMYNPMTLNPEVNLPATVTLKDSGMYQVGAAIMEKGTNKFLGYSNFVNGINIPTNIFAPEIKLAY